MKIRRLMSLGLGAAAGASAMYLLDPDQGRSRRRELVSTAWQRMRETDVRAARQRGADRAAQTSRELLTELRRGYAEAVND